MRILLFLMSLSFIILPTIAFAETMLRSQKVYVIDGDTVKLKGIKVRLHGLHAPELDTAEGQAEKYSYSHYKFPITS